MKVGKYGKIYSGYALFTDDVKASDKYRVTTRSGKIFNTKEEAKAFAILKWGSAKGTKIMKY